MEYTKENIIKINYANLRDKTYIKETIGEKIIKIIKQHKLLTTVVTAFILFSVINAIMIYNFISILQNI